MLSRLARVRLAARDPECAAMRYSALLARDPLPPSHVAGGAARPTACFQLENVGLELGPAPERGAAAGAGMEPPEGSGEGLAGLVFAAAALGRFREGAHAQGLAPRAAEGPRGRAALVFPLEATRGVPIRVEEACSTAERGAAPSKPRAADAVRGLDHVVIRTPDAEAARRLYGERLGLRLALDRAFPDWGVRLLFFRVGGLTVELAASLRESPDDEGRDRLWGLSWWVDDVAGARERLARSGFDVSAVRAGRKPGTRVATVRDGTGGVPTLLIGPDGS